MGEAKRRHELGDQPIQAQYTAAMNMVARILDQFFNPGVAGKDRKTGFVLMVFPYNEVLNEDGRCNYISNGADRREIITLMKEQIKRFEGQPDITGHA
jgi:hypothetical protein